MADSPIVIWILIGAIGGTDTILCHLIGLDFTGWARPLIATSFLGVLTLIYGPGGRDPRIAAMAHWMLLWLAFSLSGAILTYAAAAHGGALCDPVLRAADTTMGFHWQAWFDFVERHPALHKILFLAYASLMLQIVASVLYFGWRKWDRRNAELLGSVIIALIATAALFSLFPALGPGWKIRPIAQLYLATFTGLRNGSLVSVDITKIEGIIVFPSFHAVLATLITYAHRDGGWHFAAIALLNGIVLLSIPCIGGHYLIDIPAGIVVAVVAIAATRAIHWRLRTGTLPATT
jgi:PAP2 superfamily